MTRSKSIGILSDSQHWFQRAEETRTLAEAMNDPECRRRMLAIADEYESIARQAEKRTLLREIEL